MADGEEDVITPVVEYADDNKDPENYVKICVDIPGLKKKFGKNAAKNADVKLELDERSFTLTVDLLQANRTVQKHYMYHVKQLPEAITPDNVKSYSKIVRNDEVVVLLHKARKAKWVRMLAANGLETATED